MAQDSGRLTGGASGNTMPPDLLAALTTGLASAGAGSATAARSNIVPLWRARPAKTRERVNPGMFGEIAGQLPERFSVELGNAEAFTPDYAASSFLDMEDGERAEFEKMAVLAGLLKPDADPDALASAWQRAVGYAANYNQDRGEDKWISPWEAVQRLGAEQAAREGGAYDPFKPRTQRDKQRVTRSFLEGEGAESVTRTLESLFASEMGRAPSAEERNVYQKLVQAAYDANPEERETVTTTDAQGNSTATATQSGGIDMTATLLDEVREDPEAQAFAAGSTFFQAAMQALGAIA